MGNFKKYYCFLLPGIFLFNYVIYAQKTQYRRGTDLQKDYQTYEQKYQVKNLLEEKRRLYPLDKVTSSTGIWTELNPKVPRVDYIGLHFINKDTGWVCGGSGAIIKTTNGGVDWTIAETPVNNLLLKIDSYNGLVVIATGYDGIILRSEDGGDSFEQINSGVGTGVHLWGVKMINDTLGWICGKFQTLLRTTDAGQSWQPMSPGVGIHYWALDFLNEQFGFMTCEFGIILKTTDGGANWFQSQSGDIRALFSIDIIDSLHIAAVGEFGNQIPYTGGKNIYSSDGGTTWIVNPDIPTGRDANWVVFIDINTGYAINMDKGIYKTTNRGQSWSDVGGGGNWHIEILDDGKGYAGGQELGIYKKNSQTEEWNKLFLNVNWSDVYFINEEKGFLISSDAMNGGLYKTENGG